MKLQCADCGQQIPAEDMNLQTLMAKCHACDAVFSFASLATIRPAMHEAGAAGELMPRPPHMKDEQLGNTWIVTWRWYRPDHLMLLGFTICWDGFLIFWYTIAFTQGGPLIMKLFPVLHVAVGVGLTYGVLVGLCNRTTVEVSRTDIVIRHRPFPWPGNRRLATAEVEQLFCEQSSARGNNGPTYRLCAALRSKGERLTLLSGFRHIGEAQYLERMIESRVGIAPAAVIGEYRG